MRSATVALQIDRQMAMQLDEYFDIFAEYKRSATIALQIDRQMVMQLDEYFDAFVEYMRCYLMLK